MAEVFLATARSAEGEEKTVVIKRILPQYSDDPSFIQMFMDEATITARLDHPNIVRLYDMGRIDDRLFLALEYVPGTDLEELVLLMRERGETLSFAIASYLVSEALAGLHHAHTRTSADGRPMEIVHRDVTPANILLGFDGSVKLSDFGIAKAAVRHSGTSAGVVKGNFQFVAPEQVSAKRVDHRADVYSAGIVLRVLLTGKLPFEADSIAATLALVAAGDMPPLVALDPETPAAVDALVRQATAKNPDERFASAEHFRNALVACAREGGAWADASDVAALLVDLRENRSDPRMIAGKPHVVARAETAAGEASLFETRVSAATPAPEVPPLVRVELDDEEGPTKKTIIPPAARPTESAPRAAAAAPLPPPPSIADPAPIHTPATLAAFLTRVSAARDAIAAPPPPRSAPPPPAGPLSAPPISMTAPAPASTRPSGPAFPPPLAAPISAPASPSRGSVAAPAPQPAIPNVPAIAGRRPASLASLPSLRFAGHRQSVSAIAFAGPASLVSAGNDQTVRAWDLDRPAETACLRGHTGAVTSVAVGAGGVLVSGSRDKTARVWRLGATAEPPRTLAGHTGWVFATAVSPDGLLAASGGVDHTMRLWDLASGAERRVFTGHTDTVSAITFLPDGRLISASYDQTLRIWRLDSSLERTLGGGRIGAIRTVAVSSDGALAVSAGADGALRTWDLANGEPLEVLGSHEGPVVGVVFLPGSPVIASAGYDGTARLWDLRARTEIKRLDLGGAITGIAAAPDAGYLALGLGDGSLALWAP